MKAFKSIFSRGFFVPLFITFFALLMVIFPKETSKAASDSLNTCINSVFPSLFPFFVLSSLLNGTGAVRSISKFFAPLGKRLFGVSGAGFSCFVMGALGGYPVGAKCASELFEKGVCGKKETQRLLCFCNNTGPAFVLGICGAALFKNIKAGVLIYVCHILSALIIGLILNLFMGRADDSGEISLKYGSYPSFSKAFVTAVTSSVDALLKVCGFVIFFSVVTSLLDKTGFFALFSGLFAPILPFDAAAAGFLEMTGGLFALEDIDIYIALPLASFIISWAGVSVHFQTVSLFEKEGLVTARYFICKLFQGLIAAFLTAAALNVLPFSESVFYPDPYLMPYPFIPPESYFRGSIILSVGVLIFTALVYFSIVFFEKWQYNRKEKR